MRMASTWRDRFRIPTIYDAAVASANPERGMLVGDFEGQTIQVHAWEVPSGRLRPVTSSPTGTFEGWIAPDGSWVYWLADQRGNELGHLVRAPFEGGAVQDVTPELGSYAQRGVGFSRSGNRLALNPIDADGFHLYTVDLGRDGQLGQPRPVHRSRYEMWLAVLSADGELLASKSSARAGGMRRYTTLVFDAGSEGGEAVSELNDGAAASVEPVAFAPLPGDGRLLASSNTTGAVRPVIWDPRRGERLDPDLGSLEGDVLPMDWSPDAGQLLLCQYHRGIQRLHLYDLATGELRGLDLPAGTYHLPEMVGHHFFVGDTLIALQQDSSRPARVLAIDLGVSSPATRVLLASTGPEAARQGVKDGIAGRRLRSVTFPSSDGQQVQAWLGVPDGDGPFPTILDVHGGPYWITLDAFDPIAQTWLEEGFAWLSVNYRGSIGFGRDFQERIWGDIGHWELEDMVAGRAFLVELGVAAPDAVFVHGGSYGGYLTLFALGKRPDLWAGGIAQVAPVDLAEAYKEVSDALRGALKAWFGGTPEERPEAYAASSPITYAERLQAPILVFQARNDSRVGPGQMETYVQRLRQLGKSIEVVWWDGGHAYPPKDELIDSQERALRFAATIVAAKGIPVSRTQA
jgi:dipeptidyl aminopeptidase/acylaminoacyl peptidase